MRGEIYFYYWPAIYIFGNNILYISNGEYINKAPVDVELFIL